MTVETEEKKEETKTPAAPLKEGDVMDDKAAKLFSGPKPTEEKAEEKPVEEKKETPTEISYAGKKFKNNEEVERYIALLEERALKKGEEANKVDPYSMAAKLAGDFGKEEIDEEMTRLMYDNPKEFISKLQDKLYEKVQKRESVKENQQTFWNDFYSKNPELKNKERAVQLIMKEKWEEVKGLNTNDAAKFLATETRNFIKETTGHDVKIETESKGDPILAGASGVRNGSAPRKEESKPTSFFEEIKKMRKKA